MCVWKFLTLTHTHTHALSLSVYRLDDFIFMTIYYDTYDKANTPQKPQVNERNLTYSRLAALWSKQTSPNLTSELFLSTSYRLKRLDAKCIRTELAQLDRLYSLCIDTDIPDMCAKNSTNTHAHTHTHTHTIPGVARCLENRIQLLFNESSSVRWDVGGTSQAV